jgi:hypothetical protein
VNFFNVLEPEFLVVRHINCCSAFQVRRCTLSIRLLEVNARQRDKWATGKGISYHCQAVLDQLPSISLPTRRGFRAYVVKVVALTVPLSQHPLLGIMEEREEFRVETGFSLTGKREEETPRTAAEDGPPIVYALSGGKPVERQSGASNRRK